MTSKDLASIKKLLGDLRFMQAASLVSVGVGDNKQCLAYIKEINRLEKVIENEIELNTGR
jgi:hypothetical protein